jgi:CheY-like chemotaxis protein
MILFVDDETRRMKSYVQELQLLDYDVNFESNIDDALIFFESNHKQIELVVLDVMMPTGNSFSEDRSDYGLRTGICFHERIRLKIKNFQ